MSSFFIQEKDNPELDTRWQIECGPCMDLGVSFKLLSPRFRP